MNSRPTIKAEDVPHVFNGACIKRLADIGKLANNADIAILDAGLRHAANTYALEARLPNVNDVHREIGALHKAALARRPTHETVARLLQNLSPAARDEIVAAGGELILPSPDDLREPSRRKDACSTIERLCSFGGSVAAGRMRTTGRRSRTWKPVLSAPPATRHFDRRAAERNFVTNLRLTILEATGRSPARTADPRNPGPFARMTTECFRLLGAPHVNAVELINELDRRGRAVEERAATSKKDRR